MELTCDSFEIKFEALPLLHFYIYIRNECVELPQPVIYVLLLSATTYLW